MRNDVPFLSSVTKSIVPLCIWTTRNVMANPMPDPVVATTAPNASLNGAPELCLCSFR